MTTPIPPRAERCLLLLERTNGVKIKPDERCPNPRLPGSRLCAHHLAECAHEFRRITEQRDG